VATLKSSRLLPWGFVRIRAQCVATASLARSLAAGPESRSADAKRDRYLATLGYRTLRIPARSVHSDLDGVLLLIRAALQR